MKFDYIYLCVSLTYINLINCDDEVFKLDLNDILNEDLMPTRLLFLQGSHNNSNIRSVNQTDNVAEQRSIALDDGTISNAISTMRFHRKMMNEYMCTNFLAEQIVNEVNPIQTKLEKRIGSSMGAPDQLDIKENMLFDQGSSGYKNWLSKTTILDDIYQHYVPQIPANVSQDAKFNKKSDIVGHNYDDDYEEGEVTGYAYHQPEQSPRVNTPVLATQPTPLNTLGLGGGQFESAADYNIGSLDPIGPTALSKTGYFPSGHGSYFPTDYGYPANQYEPTKSMTKDIDLKDIFEIALTTLAFLSFGMFILHVLMCITMTKTDTNLMMMPMEEIPDVETIGEEVRKKRSAANPILNSNIRDINEITRTVLKSIEAVLVANEDKAQCLHLTLCENNKQYRNRTDDQKIWMPVWGLGLSWLSSKMVTTETKATSILESLKATALGIGGADCAKLYATCDESIQHNERKLRRRKREAELYELKLNYDQFVK